MSKEPKLPVIITDLTEAQNNFDSTAYAALFTTDAHVHDEGHDHIGRAAIQKWNEATNEKYRTQLEPLTFSGDEKEGVLEVLVSGNFDGSPITLHYHFTFENGRIRALRIG
jgi:ketosteroid isomerase-like protein